MVSMRFRHAGKRTKAPGESSGPTSLRVAQIFNLLYRRILFCRAQAISEVPGLFENLADYKSAIQQNTILRYTFRAIVPSLQEG